MKHSQKCWAAIPLHIQPEKTAEKGAEANDVMLGVLLTHLWGKSSAIDILFRRLLHVCASENTLTAALKLTADWSN